MEYDGRGKGGGKGKDKGGGKGKVPPSAMGPPVIPMLHGLMMGFVKLVTPKGAIMRLTDGSPMNYFDGLVRQRKGAEALKSGDKMFVKVVRIEPGLAIVDAREVDQKAGQDKDPFNELAEVEDWVDVPLALVGRIIGLRGARIRQICDESGADLRFDTSAPTPATGSSAGQHGGGGGGTAVVGGAGQGADLKRFLEDAQQEDATAPVSKPGASGDGADLCRFLEEARGSGGDGSDLAKFMQEAKGDSEHEEEDDHKSDARGSEDESKDDAVVEFMAHDIGSWEKQLEAKMEEAGVSQIYFENLSMTNAKGRSVDLSRGGLKPGDFPVTVRYCLPKGQRKQKAPKKPESKRGANGEDTQTTPVHSHRAKTEENDAGKAGVGKDASEEVAVDTAERVEPRPEVVHISGAERLTKSDFDELFELRGLPDIVDFQHLSKTEVLCIFKNAEDAEEALLAAQEGFDDLPEKAEQGKDKPAMWRARRGYFKFRQATTADVKEKKAERPSRPCGGDGAAGRERPELAVTRLRINGDAIEVAKAKAAVRDLLEELAKALPAAVRRLAGQKSERMKIPHELVGRVIGKGGETIRKLEQDSGARLKVLPPRDRDEDGSAGDDGPPDQDLLIVGTPDVIQLAKELLAPILGTRAPASPRASGVPQRRKAAAADFDPNVGTGDERERGGMAARLGLPSLDGEDAGVSAFAGLRVPTGASGKGTPERAAPRKRERSPSPTKSEKVRRMRDRVRELEVQAYEKTLMRQQRLEQLVAAAEAEAREALAFLEASGKGMDEALEELPFALGAAFGDDLYEDWEEDLQPSTLTNRLALTTCGPGRVSRIVSTRHGLRFVTVALLAGGTIQVPESVAIGWVAAVDGFLGAMVIPPGAKSVASKKEAQKRGGLFAFEYMPAAVGLVVNEALVRGSRLAFRVVSPPGETAVARIVDVEELRTWERGESRLYLVELATSPASVGHVAAYRHDYRKAREAYRKGDMVVLEGAKVGTQDVGTVRKVLTGEQGEKVATALAAASSARGAGGGMRRLLWRCSELERARRDGQAAPLEKTVHPLLQARLPEGAEALGVGASLDGVYLRLFVRIAVGGLLGQPLRQKAAAAAAALGALLGCETELLLSRAPATATATKLVAAAGAPVAKSEGATAVGDGAVKEEACEKESGAKGTTEGQKVQKDKVAKKADKMAKKKGKQAEQQAKKGAAPPGKKAKKAKTGGASSSSSSCSSSGSSGSNSSDFREQLFKQTILSKVF
mmetsp:Transcript_51682/g.167897  ORF Transcript_51682/g.167897 Transcript_51682/m.167897 type:complete len:1249 (+) Transcript_51682:19-3765(+)